MYSAAYLKSHRLEGVAQPGGVLLGGHHQHVQQASGRHCSQASMLFWILI
jgi:hypothetical protein